MGPRIRRGQRGEGGFPLPSSRGQTLCGGTGMGPRIREDNGGGWIPASVVTGAGSLRGDGDGSPHPRGQRVGVDSRFRRHWGQALCGKTGMGPRIREDMTGGPVDSRFRRHWGQAPCGGTGMGPRIREDNGWGWVSRFRLHEGRLCAGNTQGGIGVPASARTTGGGAIPASVVHGGRLSVGGTGMGHPHPNLPPSTGGRDSRFRRHGGRLPAG